MTSQRLKKFTRESLQEWIEGLCDSFAGDDSQRCYQGDGDATLDVAVGLIDGIPQLMGWVKLQMSYIGGIWRMLKRKRIRGRETERASTLYLNEPNK